MPPSTHLPLVEKVLGLQLTVAGASISTTSRILRVSETTARQLRKSIAAAAAEGRQAGQAVREAFVVGHGVDDAEAWRATRRAAADLLADRLAELPPGRGRPVDVDALAEAVDGIMREDV